MSCPAPLPLLSVRRPGLGSRAKEGSFYCLQSWVCLAALPPSVNLLNPKGRAGEGGQDTPGARCCAQSWLCSSAPRIPATSTAEGCEALGSSKQSRGAAGKGRSPFPQGFPVPPCLHKGMSSIRLLRAWSSLAGGNRTNSCLNSRAPTQKWQRHKQQFYRLSAFFNCLEGMHIFTTRS